MTSKHEEDDTERFVRETLESLQSGPEAREAVQLLAGVGFLAVDDPSKIDDACERLALLDDDGRKSAADLKAWDRKFRTKAGDFKGDALKAFQEYEDLSFHSAIVRGQVGYLLGIAVGMRLSGGIVLTGGARK